MGGSRSHRWVVWSREQPGAQESGAEVLWLSCSRAPWRRLHESLVQATAATGRPGPPGALKQIAQGQQELTR